MQQVDRELERFNLATAEVDQLLDTYKDKVNSAEVREDIINSVLRVLRLPSLYYEQVDVVCDSSNNPPWVVDNGDLVVIYQVRTNSGRMFRAKRNLSGLPTAADRRKELEGRLVEKLKVYEGQVTDAELRKKLVEDIMYELDK